MLRLPWGQLYDDLRIDKVDTALVLSAGSEDCETLSSMSGYRIWALLSDSTPPQVVGVYVEQTCDTFTLLSVQPQGLTQLLASALFCNRVSCR